MTSSKLQFRLGLVRTPVKAPLFFFYPMPFKIRYVKNVRLKISRPRCGGSYFKAPTLLFLMVPFFKWGIIIKTMAYFNYCVRAPPYPKSQVVRKFRQQVNLAILTRVVVETFLRVIILLVRRPFQRYVTIYNDNRLLKLPPFTPFLKGDAFASQVKIQRILTNVSYLVYYPCGKPEIINFQSIPTSQQYREVKTGRRLYLIVECVT